MPSIYKRIIKTFFTLPILLLIACNSTETTETTETGNSNNKKKLISNVFPNVKQLNQKLYIAGNKLPRVDAHINNIIRVPLPNQFRFSDVRLLKRKRTWKINNSTPQSVSRLTATFGNDKAPVEITLDGVLPPYSEADISSPTHDLGDFILFDQLILFSPKVTLSGYSEMDGNKDCSRIIMLCYSQPLPSERVIYERVLSHFHNIYNTKSFALMMERYFSDQRYCDLWSWCKGYTDNYLSYAKKSLLTLGIKEHNLRLWTLYNAPSQLAGRGGGAMPSINNDKSSRGGWASLKSNYMHGVVNYPTVMKIVVHEVGHAYGFNHNTGMTYGLFDDTFSGYLRNHNFTSLTLPNVANLQLPAVIMQVDKASLKEADLTFYYPDSKPEYSSVYIELLSSSIFDVKIHHYQGEADAKLIFDSVPSAPIYIRAVTENGEYISTALLTFENT